MKERSMNKAQVAALWDLLQLGSLEREKSGDSYPGKTWAFHDSRTVISLVHRGFAAITESFHYGYAKKVIPTEKAKKYSDEKEVKS